MQPQQIMDRLERHLMHVEKPGRYIGGEWNSIVKNWDTASTRIALAFPDIYELGMSNLGLAILYDKINRQPDMLAERVFNPWDDLAQIMDEQAIPLFALESKRPIRDFDILGISLPYEQLYTNVLSLLKLSGLPLRSLDRDEDYPLVIAGGHACTNPEPMHAFIDAFVIGEGEEIIVEIAEKLRELGSASREQQLLQLAQIAGLYVPRFYDVSYKSDGTVERIIPNRPGISQKVIKRIVPVLPRPVTRFIVPNISTVHNRAPIEVMRGCTRGCRFCHAGMITRPVRERPPAEVLAAVEDIITATGYEEISLLSLSSSDYAYVHELTQAIQDEYSSAGISMSLPSLRIETASADLLDRIGDTRRSGFTFAPEAATERMRDIINKAMSDEQIVETAKSVFQRGWRTIKFYFMIGHPDETLEDIQAIINLCKAVLKEGRRILGPKAQVNVGISTFIPKPHTPFQWVPQDDKDHIQAKLRLLRDSIRHLPGMQLRWTDIHNSRFEGFLSRGDRRLSDVIERAWELGCSFDAWNDHHFHNKWLQAFQEHGLNPDFYNHRQRAIDEVFPWDHIDMGVRKKYLLEDYLMSGTQDTRVDCRDRCFACGILPKFSEKRQHTEVNDWQCPPVKPIARRKPDVTLLT